MLNLGFNTKRVVCAQNCGFNDKLTCSDTVLLSSKLSTKKLLIHVSRLLIYMPYTIVNKNIQEKLSDESITLAMPCHQICLMSIE